MTRTLFVASTILASFSTIASADDSPAEQQQVARSLGEKVQRFEMWTDDDGNLEREVRPIAKTHDWTDQRKMWAEIVQRLQGPPPTEQNES